MRATFFGPVLFYELLCTARRARYTLARTLYALGLLSLFALMYAEYPALSSGQVQAQDMSQFATSFFYAFLVFQYLLAALLTPAYVAGAIAEEKERRTLEFIMATDLRSREIVLSKFCARVANLLMLLLAGLPVLSFIQLFGGVDPLLLWSGFAATGMTILSIAALSILLSVYMNKARPAIIRSFMLVILFMMLYLLAIYSLGALLVTYAGTRLSFDERPWAWQAASWVVEIYGLGHPVQAILSFMDPRSRGGLDWLTGITLARTPMQVLRNYCLFHGVLVVLCIGLSIWRLRPVFLRQAFGESKARPAKRGKAALRHPPVGEAPMLWKELRVERGRTTWAARILFIVIVLVCLAPSGIIYYAVWLDQSRGWGTRLGDSMRIYAMLIGPVVAIMLVLGIGSRAAGSVGSERDRQTLESLLTTPLKLREILGAKWVAAVWAGRPVAVLLVIVWGISLLNGGISLQALALLPVLVVLQACQAASLGLFFSAFTRTTLRATVTTAGVQIFLLGGFWFCCGPLVALANEDKLATFLLGFTPPIAIGAVTSIGGEDSAFRNSIEAFNITAGIVLGCAAAATMSAILWFAAIQAFRRQCGRLEGG